MDEVAQFDAAILIRGANSVKSVALLMEQGHWEHATGVVRQLFELLVNMEHLNRMPDRAAATLLYCRFGVLQQIRARHRQCLYTASTGRPVNAEHLKFLEHHLAHSFGDFQGKPKSDGSPRWVSAWHKKTTRDLAELSTDKMRVHQYDQLYSVWSEQTHAAPGALMESIFREAHEGWVDAVVESDDKKIIETASMALMLFVQLWWALPNVPVLEPERVMQWMLVMMEIMAVPEFDSLPGYRLDNPS
ncbi:DUF5677 domain-containing protein [Streptomyces sp. NPDC056707]|uniref:DUF5677 domain-containing protein n=1 Tax=Streptomyces sp. NPDC056707 TaxID=3345919 RepID=UPI0036943DE3